MTNDILQEIATFALVGMAALYVIRRAWLVFHPEAPAGGCGSGGCGSCPSNAAHHTGEPPIQVVSIGMPPSRNGKSV